MLLSVVAHRPRVPARGCARVRTCVLRDCVCKWCITARNVLVHVRVDCDGGYECRYKRKQESDADSEVARKPAEDEE